MGMPHAMLQNRLSLRPSHIADLRLAASKMTGPARRAFEAEMTLTYCAGTPLMAAAVLGWGRHTVALGLAERRSGRICRGSQAACSGRKRGEEQHPQAAQALRDLAEAHAPQAPTLRTGLTSTRLTAHAALEALRDQGYREDHLPSPRTMAEVLHRTGLRWRKVLKAQPQKKSKETDAIVDHMKKKRPKRRPPARANACGLMVKRRAKLVSFLAGVSPAATTAPGITTWAAKRHMGPVGSSMKRVAPWRSPLAAPTQRVISWRR